MRKKHLLGFTVAILLIILVIDLLVKRQVSNINPDLEKFSRDKISKIVSDSAKFKFHHLKIQVNSVESSLINKRVEVTYEFRVDNVEKTRECSGYIRVESVENDNSMLGFSLNDDCFKFK